MLFIAAWSRSLNSLPRRRLLLYPVQGIHALSRFYAP
jgi:hypothetical protein